MKRSIVPSNDEVIEGEVIDDTAIETRYKKRGRGSALPTIHELQSELLARQTQDRQLIKNTIFNNNMRKQLLQQQQQEQEQKQNTVYKELGNKKESHVIEILLILFLLSLACFAVAIILL